MLAYVDAIKAVPPWSTNSLSQSSDWRPIVKVAAALQELHPDVYTILVLFITDQFSPDNLSERRFMGCLLESSRVMLVLRVMFDIPDESVRMIANEDILSNSNRLRLTICGGIPFEPVEDGVELESSYSLPMKWETSGPRLVAKPRTLFGGSFTHYQVHLEYRAMLEEFEYREGLRDWLQQNESNENQGK